MQARDFYDVGLKAYYGDEDAARAFFAKLAAVLVPIAKIYAVLPSFAMAKCVIESGYMTNEWNHVAEAISGKKLKAKAQAYNNIFSMNAFSENQKYLDCLPLPAWASRRDTFADYGPHGDSDDALTFAFEPWKAYRTVEDAIEDWCANVRYQAESHGHSWNPSDIHAQLIATESYTPEGSREGVRDGLHYCWQEQILQLVEQYGLSQYDREDKTMTKVKVTTAALDEHVKRAYEYAHAHCHYAPTDRVFPPFADEAADCAGLLLRAAYTMGYNNGRKNINQVPEVCEAMGLVKSTDPNDAWRHHGVVCMQDKHLTGTAHVSHVYYSLGGSGLDRISKFDLGSDRRIKCKQPYTGVPVNEWANDRNFLCVYYVKEKTFREDTPYFKALSAGVGHISVKTGLYAGPGTAWRRIGTTDVGAEVILRGVVTNDSGNQWRSVCYNSMQGYVPVKAVVETSFDPYVGMVSGTDGSLSVRVGAGVGAYKVGDIPEGKNVEVDNLAFADDGGKWLHIRAGKIRGYVAAQYVIKA